MHRMNMEQTVKSMRCVYFSLLAQKKRMLKYVNCGIVFQEIPDEVTLSINISNCPCHCPGCHSDYLWEDIGLPLDKEAMDCFMEKYASDITCICFMGGDAEPAEVDKLAAYVRSVCPEMKVGWYSGRQEISTCIGIENFDYIKVGPYIKGMGALKERTTNQRLYKRLADNSLEDITEHFWKK